MGVKFGKVKSPAAAVHPTMMQLGWAAGFIEGEGTFAGHRKTCRCERITVNQVQKEPLERLASYLGGSILSRQRHHSQPIGQPYWTWQATGPRARGIMMSIYPLMSPKRKEQIRKALSK